MKLYDSDYLLGVCDETRMGVIRLKLDEAGPFVSDDMDSSVPPWTSLRTLEEASRNFEKDEKGLSNKWIAQLLKPGSSLGGARPKSTVTDTDGNLWIAKFPSKNDEIDNGSYYIDKFHVKKMRKIQTNRVFVIMGMRFFIRAFTEFSQITILLGSKKT